MTDTRKVMQQALEALEKLNKDGWVLADFENMVYEAIEALRSALAQQGEQQPVQSTLFDCDIQPRPLAHQLRDYHLAPSEGPLNYTWQDKPHRLLYDLIAAVKYYAAAPAAQPDARKVIEQMLGALDSCVGDSLLGGQQRKAAIAAGQKLLKELK